MRLLIIGGDARNRHLATLARARGHAVALVGHEAPPLLLEAPYERAVMPFPIAETDGCAPAPLTDQRLEMSAMCELIAPKATVYATKPGPVLIEYILKKGCTRIDFMDSEAFAVRNAVPSAEGGIHALMSRAERTIDDSDCLIVGYGRIGRALALRLRGLGARVTVAARSDAARANARNDGCRAVPIGWMKEPHACRFFINTVPDRVIDRAMLAALPTGALALDLASAPFGFDLEEARALGVVAWREPGLPGRYSPETAAAVMLTLIEEQEGF